MPEDIGFDEDEISCYEAGRPVSSEEVEEETEEVED